MVLAERAVDTSGVRPQYWLCRAEDHSRFAYVRVHDFYRESDHELWARLEGEWLLSVRSGRPLARQFGSVFFDTDTDEPVYFYESSY